MLKAVFKFIIVEKCTHVLFNFNFCFVKSRFQILLFTFCYVYCRRELGRVLSTVGKSGFPSSKSSERASAFGLYSRFLMAEAREVASLLCSCSRRFRW